MVLVINGLDRALGYARTAVNAVVWVDVKHLIAFPKAISRAHDHAVGVFAAEARLGNDERHLCLLHLAGTDPLALDKLMPTAVD
jgi:hypothetical protein